MPCVPFCLLNDERVSLLETKRKNKTSNQEELEPCYLSHNVDPLTYGKDQILNCLDDDSKLKIAMIGFGNLG